MLLKFLTKVVVIHNLRVAVTVRLEPRNRTEEPRTELVGSDFFILLFRFLVFEEPNFYKNQGTEPNRTEEPNAQAYLFPRALSPQLLILALRS